MVALHTAPSTIVAIATPRGVGGIGVVRLSGPDSWAIAQALVQAKAQAWTPGKAVYGWVVDPQDQTPVDEVLVLPFKAPKSFTGEDVVEIQAHGGLGVMKTLLSLCLAQGAQGASAGEFTRRAVLNGRIDLAQAESILDLIHSEGEAMVKLSAQNLKTKAISQLLAGYVTQISSVLADVAAAMDFPDEVDEPDRGALTQRLEALVGHIQSQIAVNRRNQVFREGVEVALCGLPNAGKSALFNALLSADRAIVTEIAGTTRDTLRETFSVAGIPVTLVDTAGLRDTVDRVEQLGVAKSREAMDTAQAVIYVVDSAEGLTPQDEEIRRDLPQKPTLTVWSKGDLQAHPPQVLGENSLCVSAQTGTGIDGVLAWLGQVVEALPDRSAMAYLLSTRQLAGLEAVLADLSDSLQAVACEALPLDVVSVGLTSALLELQGVLGVDTTESMLDTVFSRFCVGK